MRDSSSVRLTWSLGRGPGVGGLGFLPPVFFPLFFSSASRLAIFASYSACACSKRTCARFSISFLACSIAARRFFAALEFFGDVHLLPAAKH